jgi:endonuclease YncB( thermonuclease family)
LRRKKEIVKKATRPLGSLRKLGGLVGIPDVSAVALDALAQELGLPSDCETKCHSSGKVERVYDGVTLTHYPNGTSKESDADGYTIRFLNGDWKREERSGRTVYWFKENGTKQTTEDGVVVYEFAGGQTETCWRDGRHMVVYADGTVRRVDSEGREVTEFVDGTVQKVGRDGKKEIVKLCEQVEGWGF